MLDQKEVAAAMPRNLRSSVTPSLIAKVNAASTDPEIAETIRENFMGYVRVLEEGRFKIEDYLNAVAYVSYRLMNFTKEESYSRTFPQRYNALIARGVGDISPWVSGYDKGKLVNLIMEQSLIPTWVLNQDVYQDAINTQALLMKTAKSELVRTQAANSLLTHIKRPEKQQVELNIGVPENSALIDLSRALDQMADMQRSLIDSGVTTKEVAHQKIIDITPQEDTEE